MPGVSWNDLLRHVGSRARRRDRTVCSMISISEVSEAVYRQVLHCMYVADAFKDDLASPERAGDAQMAMDDAAHEAVESLLKTLGERMKSSLNPKASICSGCPSGDKCRAAFLRPDASQTH
jgi:hypothetical protein